MTGEDLRLSYAGPDQGRTRLSNLAVDSRVHRVAMGVAAHPPSLAGGSPGLSLLARLLRQRTAAVIRRTFRD